MADLTLEPPIRSGTDVAFGGKTTVTRTAVPSLLYDRRQLVTIPEAPATTNFIDNHIFHTWNGKIIAISGHQIIGDVNLSDLRLATDGEGNCKVNLGERIYDAFRQKKLPPNWKERAI